MAIQLKALLTTAMVLLAGAQPAKSSAPEPIPAAAPCAPDSPERRGQAGCTILADQPIVRPTSKLLYWHIDRYDTLGAAKENAGPNSVVAAAHGAVWLMTVEPKTTRRHRLHHIAWVGPFKLPVDKRYAMRVQSSTLVPGGGTPVHTHSGPEAFYIVSGEQCIETPLATRRLTSGSAEFVPANTIHRGRITGNGPRRALAIVIYDATRPVSKNVVEAPQLASCD